MKKIWGNISHAFAKAIDFLLKGLLNIIEFITNLGDKALKTILPFLMLGLIGAFMFPPLLILLFSPLGMSLITLLIFLVIIPMLGRGALQYLNRLYFVSTNYFYDYANHYRNNGKKNKTFKEYSKIYTDKLNEKIEAKRRRAEQERRKRQEAENERWRKFFEENFGQYNSYNQGRYSQGGYYQGNQNSYNPFNSFKKQYEEACDVLNVSYHASFDEIKKQYRILAKKYHPDLSKERNAEEMFKKVNNAFDFLSEENVKRYNQL